MGNQNFILESMIGLTHTHNQPLTRTTNHAHAHNHSHAQPTTPRTTTSTHTRARTPPHGKKPIAPTDQLADHCLEELADQKERLLAINRKLRDMDVSIEEAQNVRYSNAVENRVCSGWGQERRRGGRVARLPCVYTITGVEARIPYCGLRVTPLMFRRVA